MAIIIVSPLKLCIVWYVKIFLRIQGCPGILHVLIFSHPEEPSDMMYFYFFYHESSRLKPWFIESDLKLLLLLFWPLISHWLINSQELFYLDQGLGGSGVSFYLTSQWKHAMHMNIHILYMDDLL